MLEEIQLGYNTFELELRDTEERTLLKETFNPITGWEYRVKSRSFDVEEIEEWELNVESQMESPREHHGPEPREVQSPREPQSERKRFQIVRTGNRGFGFAKSLEAPFERDVFWHISEAKAVGRLIEGQIITARLVKTTRGWQAHQIHPDR